MTPVRVIADKTAHAGPAPGEELLELTTSGLGSLRVSVDVFRTNFHGELSARLEPRRQIGRGGPGAASDRAMVASEFAPDDGDGDVQDRRYPQGHDDRAGNGDTGVVDLLPRVAIRP